MAAVIQGWRVGVLGHFSLGYNHRAVRVTRGTARILAYLAVQERSHRRDQVAWTLWGELSEEHALAALRSALWRLPREPAHRLVDCHGYHLSLDAHVAVDLRTAHALFAALAAGGELPGDADLAAMMQDVLPGWYDDWIEFPRERLRQRRLHALEAASRRCVEAGNFGRAIDYALWAIECEPLRETAHGCLIAAHLAEGNLTEAIRQRDAYLVRLTAAGLPPVLPDDVDALLRVSAPDTDTQGLNSPTSLGGRNPYA